MRGFCEGVYIMNATYNRVSAIVLGVSVVAGSLAPVSTVYATKGSDNGRGQSTSHLVFCQKTGNHWTVTKGDNPSDNKNRTQVGVWDEHERGEGWNQAKADQEFLNKCAPTVQDTDETSKPVTALPAPAPDNKDKAVPHNDRGQSTSHLVFCQKTGNHYTITKGDNPSDNKNRTQVGTWNEHERGEGWNQKKAEAEFLSKCAPAVDAVAAPATPGKGGVNTPAPVAAVGSPAPVASIDLLPHTGLSLLRGILVALGVAASAYAAVYAAQAKRLFR